MTRKAKTIRRAGNQKRKSTALHAIRRRERELQAAKDVSEMDECELKRLSDEQKYDEVHKAAGERLEALRAKQLSLIPYTDLEHDALKAKGTKQAEAKRELQRRRKAAKSDLAARSLSELKRLLSCAEIPKDLVDSAIAARIAEELDKMSVTDLQILLRRPDSDWPLDSVRHAVRRKRRAAMRELDQIAVEDLRQRLGMGDKEWPPDWIKAAFVKRINASFCGKSDSELRCLAEAGNDDTEKAIAKQILKSRRKRGSKGEKGGRVPYTSRDPIERWRFQN